MHVTWELKMNTYLFDFINGFASGYCHYFPLNMFLQYPVKVSKYQSINFWNSLVLVLPPCAVMFGFNIWWKVDVNANFHSQNNTYHHSYNHLNDSWGRLSKYLLLFTLFKFLQSKENYRLCKEFDLYFQKNIVDVRSFNINFIFLI